MKKEIKNALRARLDANCGRYKRIHEDYELHASARFDTPSDCQKGLKIAKDVSFLSLSPRKCNWRKVFRAPKTKDKSRGN